jgi:hypothetical protein
MRSNPDLKFFLLVILFASLVMNTNTAFSQMRLLYVDDLTPGNPLSKISFFSATEGYVTFKDKLCYTSDSGRNFIGKGIAHYNTNYNGYNIIPGTPFKINGVKAFNIQLFIPLHMHNLTAVSLT